MNGCCEATDICQGPCTAFCNNADSSFLCRLCLGAAKRYSFIKLEPPVGTHSRDKLCFVLAAVHRTPTTVLQNFFFLSYAICDVSVYTLVFFFFFFLFQLTSELKFRIYWLELFSGHDPLNLPSAVSNPTLLHPLAAHVNQGRDRESQPVPPLPSWSSVGAQQETQPGTMSFLHCCELDRKRKLSSVNFSACLGTVYGARTTARSSLQWGTLDFCSSFPEGIHSISGCRKMFWRKHVR